MFFDLCTLLFDKTLINFRASNLVRFGALISAFKIKLILFFFVKLS